MCSDSLTFLQRNTMTILRFYRASALPRSTVATIQIRLAVRRRLLTTYHWSDSTSSISTHISTADGFSEALQECFAQSAQTTENVQLLLTFALNSSLASAAHDLGSILQGKAREPASLHPPSADGISIPARGGEPLTTPRDTETTVERIRRLRRGMSADSASESSLVIPASGVLRAWGRAGSSDDAEPARNHQALIGCTGADFMEGASGLSAMVARLCFPPDVSLEPFTVSGSGLPSLQAYAQRLKEDDTHFLLLASPAAHPRNDIYALADRLGRVFPRAMVAGGAAMTPDGFSSSRRRPQGTQGGDNSLTGTNSVGIGADLPSPLLFTSSVDVDQSSVSAVGVAIHGLGHSPSARAYWRRVIGAVFSSVELASFFSNQWAETGAGTLIGVRGLMAGPYKTGLETAAAPDAGTTPAAVALPAIIETVPAALKQAVPPPMPIFCLDRPIAPGETFDVRIFEPRYRLMARQYFTHGQLFAVGMRPALTPVSLRQAADGKEEAHQYEGVRSTRTALQDDSAPVPAYILSAHERAVCSPATGPAHEAPASTSTYNSSSSGSDADSGASSGRPARVGTACTVVQVHEASDQGGLVLRLRGERRVRWSGTWIAPRSFGLWYGKGTWMDDVGSSHKQERGEAAGSVDSAMSRERELASSLCSSINTLWTGSTQAHGLLRKILHETPSGPWQGLPWAKGTLAAASAASPEALSWHQAAVLPVSNSIRQEWLEMGRTSSRLASQQDYLVRKLDDLSFRSRSTNKPAVMKEPKSDKS